MRIRIKELKHFVRGVLQEVNEYSWEHADNDNLMLDIEPGMEKSDRERVKNFLKAMKLTKS